MHVYMHLAFKELIKTHSHTIQCYLKATEHKLQLLHGAQCAIDVDYTMRDGVTSQIFYCKENQSSPYPKSFGKCRKTPGDRT